MAGTVVLDDVELREAQRDYLDFLDDEVREAPSHEIRALGGPGAAQEPRKAAETLGAKGDRGAPGCGGGAVLGTFRLDLVAFLAAESVVKSNSVIFLSSANGG